MTGRLDRVLAELASRELDALLVTDLVNLRWLTGFTGSNGLAVLGWVWLHIIYGKVESVALAVGALSA